MPAINISEEELKRWGKLWLSDENPENEKKKDKAPFSFDRQQSVRFASFIDLAVGQALATALGGIPVVKPNSKSLLPEKIDCIEVGAVRVIGGVRPQNYDVAYRPDGPRIVFDSKTLNEEKSVGKNWQNMINDLATEATTIHTRFPYAIVAFIVVVPKPALGAKQEFDIIRTLERLGSRKDVLDQAHLAEAISLIIWNPETGEIDKNIPNLNSPLRIETFSDTLFPHYLDRYKGLPPHSEEDSDEEEE
ncbi:MAG TPA: hypothetical protein DHW49_03425 [Anaerolineae bacterium]|nr:hypothetical protein [Anaerolineae bacterium]